MSEDTDERRSTAPAFIGSGDILNLDEQYVNLKNGQKLVEPWDFGWDEPNQSSNIMEHLPKI